MSADASSKCTGISPRFASRIPRSEAFEMAARENAISSAPPATARRAALLASSGSTASISSRMRHPPDECAPRTKGKSPGAASINFKSGEIFGPIVRLDVNSLRRAPDQFPGIVRALQVLVNRVFPGLRAYGRELGKEVFHGRHLFSRASTISYSVPKGLSARDLG